MNTIKIGDWSHPYAQILDRAYNDATQLNHKLSNDVLNMQGMSGRKYRTLINRLVEYTPNPRYLEIGSWKGSTVCSAMYNNAVTVKCIDSWGIIGNNDVQPEFLRNIDLYKTPDVDFSFIHDDYINVDYSSIGKYNIYLFDGPHDHKDHYNGVIKILSALDDEYVLIIDDYNDIQVQEGTRDGLIFTNQQIIASLTILTDNNPYLNGSDWHNGYFIAIVKKG